MAEIPENIVLNVTAPKGDSIPPLRIPHVSSFPEKPPEGDDAAHESTLLYAACAGLAAATSVPVFSDWLAAVARGAALRRVAQRYGVTLSVEARSVLAAAGTAHAVRSQAFRVATSFVAQATKPLRVFARVEESISAALSAILFEHYLRSIRKNTNAIGANEARRLRGAMDEAIRKTTSGAIRSAPASLRATVMNSYAAVRDGDLDGRSSLECFVDTWLDAVADAPHSIVMRARGIFDEAISLVEHEQ